MNKRSHQTTRQGLTYLETMVAAALVGLVVVAGSRVVVDVAQGILRTERRVQAAALADELLAEILAAAYEDPDQPPVFGLETGEQGTTRTAFDDVDDYDGWAAQPPQAKDGTVLTKYQPFRRSVSVTPVALNDLTAVVAADSAGLKRIVVTVSIDNVMLARRTAVVGRHAGR